MGRMPHSFLAAKGALLATALRYQGVCGTGTMSPLCFGALAEKALNVVTRP